MVAEGEDQPTVVGPVGASEIESEMESNDSGDDQGLGG